MIGAENTYHLQTSKQWFGPSQICYFFNNLFYRAVVMGFILGDTIAAQRQTQRQWGKFK